MEDQLSKPQGFAGGLKNPVMDTRTTKANHVLILFFTAYTISAFFKISANIVIPVFQNRFGISSSFSGLISGMYYLPYAFQQLFAAPLSRKYGASGVVAVGFVIAAAGSILFAFASNALMVMAGRCLVGVGVGPVFVSIVQYLTEHFTGRKFALYTGLAVTFSGFGQAVASAPLKILIERFGITNVFLYLSVIMLAVSLSLLLTGKTVTKRDSAGATEIFRQISVTGRSVIKNPVLILITLSWVFYNSIQHSYQGLWSAKWMAFAFPDKTQLSGLSATLVSVGLM
ncbi:MAG: MFS transporter, partial [Sphaerochaetaceae bacterium]|nr:MFS transporter [Sphaerochaetaceae bacterium]